MTLTSMSGRRYKTLQEAVDRIDELESLAGLDDVTRAMAVFGLSRSEAKLACLVARRQIATREAIDAVVHGNDSDCDLPRLTAQFMVRCRRKLAPHGIGIGNIHGVGFSMPPESRANWRKKIAESSSEA